MIIFAICYFTISFSFTLGGTSYNGDECYEILTQ